MSEQPADPWGWHEPPLVPEIRLHLATEITPIWQATQSWLAETGIEPPFWAFAWPGGQALARHVLDHPAQVRGRRVLDFAAGDLAGLVPPKRRRRATPSSDAVVGGGAGAAADGRG